MVNEIEKKAMEYAIQYEKEHGRNPTDMSDKNKGYDIKSGNKIIEVKGRKEKKGKTIRTIQFNQYNYAAMQRALENNEEYLLYVVKISDDEIKLREMDVTEIIKRAKVRHGYEIKLRVDDFK